MARLTATKVIRNNKDITFTFDNTTAYAINLFMHEIWECDKISVTAKKHSESRSIRQNSMLWALLGKISDAVNGSHRDDDVMNIYKVALKKANAKYVILAAVPQAKDILEQQFRFVEVLPNSMTTEKGVKMIAFKCYIGSSKFDTKEMTELIDVALDLAHIAGVKDSEIESIREEYR